MPKSDSVHLESDSLLWLPGDVNSGIHVTKIHIAENGILVGNLNHATMLPVQPISIWRFFAVIVGVFVICWLFSFMGTQSAIIFGSAALGGLAPVAFIASTTQKKARRNRLRQRILDLQFESRLWAIGNENDVAEIAELRDVPFEPVIVSVERSFLRPVIAVLIGFVVTLSILIGIQRLLPFHWYMALALMIPPVLGIVTWLLPKFAPAYYRMTPGRLELLRFNALRRDTRNAVVRTWDLRTADIYWMNHGIDISDAGESGDSTLINVLQLGEPQQFVYSLFRAAISTHESPPLPADRLTIE